MDLSKEEIEKLSTEEIYQIYKELFDNIYYTNNFNRVSLTNYLNIVFEEIESSKIEYTGKTKYELFIQKRVLQRAKSEDTTIRTDIVSEYLNDIENLPTYNKEEELELIKKAQNGDIEARNKIIEGNLKLVINISKRFMNKGTPFEDLIQEGNFGLIRAIEKYNDNMGAKFSTYAVWWIRQMILRSIANKSNTIRIPVYLFDRINNYKKTYFDLTQKFNREPTMEEISKEMGLSLENVRAIALYSIKPTSLNDFIFEEENIELQDSVADKEAQIEKNVIDKIDALLTSGLLSERELIILKLRCGFDDNDPLTLEEIGQRIGVTRERVRQLENRALNKIRSSNKIFNFIDYMDSPKNAYNSIKKVYDYMNGKRGNEKSNNEEFTFNNDGTIDRNEIKTIYEYFPRSSTYKINTAISKLNILDQFFLYFRYGGDLNKPYSYELTINQKKYFDEVLIPTLRYILKNIDKEENNDLKSDVKLESNSFTKTDLKILKMCFKKYKNINIEYQYSYNNYFIKLLTDGFINRKSFSKNEIMEILNLTEKEYNDCILEDQNILENLQSTKRLIKKK